MSQPETIARPSSSHPLVLQPAAKVFKFLIRKLWHDPTRRLWELRELYRLGPIIHRDSLLSARLTDQQGSEAAPVTISGAVKHKRADERPAGPMTIQEQAAQLCESYKELFEFPHGSHHPVTLDEERHTATMMHMILPHLARQIRNLSTPQIYQHILAEIDQATHDCKREGSDARVFLENLIEDVEARLVPLVIQAIIDDSWSADRLGFARNRTQPDGRKVVGL